MTADDLDDRVPPDENDGTSGEGSATTPPVSGSADDAADTGQGDDQPGKAPVPGVDRPNVPLRNLRALDRRFDEEEPRDTGLDDAGAPDVPPAAGLTDSGWPDSGWQDSGWPDSGWPDDPFADTGPSDVRDHGIEPGDADAPTTAMPTTALPTATDPIPVGPPAGRPLTDLALHEDEAEAGDGESDGGKARSPLRSLVEWVVVIVGALVVATIIKTFLFQAFWIPSDSMQPTLQIKDRVLVNKLSYDLHDVRRGDVVVFERPPGETEKIKDLIKRVVAIEGDTLTLENGKVLVNGEALDEPYLPEGSETVNICAFTGTVKVPEDHVFVMGDNRENSKDSRCFGPIDEDLIVGRAFVKVWPLNALGTL